MTGVDTPSRWARLDEHPRWQIGWFVGGTASMVGWEDSLPVILRGLLIMFGAMLIIMNAHPALYPSEIVRPGPPDRRRS